MKRSIIFISCLFLLACSLEAGEKMRVAILDLKPQKIGQDTASLVSSILHTELFRTGLFRLVRVYGI